MLFQLVRRVVVSAIVVGSGLAYQYIRLQRRSDEQRRLIEAKIEQTETRLLEDHAQRFGELTRSVDEKTAHVRQYTGERCDSIETQLRDIDVRHSKALETLEVRSREILAIARKNEQKIIALLHQIAPEPTTQS